MQNNFQSGAINAGRIIRGTACELKMHGCTGTGNLIVDPFDQDMYGETNWIVACANCQAERAYEI